MEFPIKSCLTSRQRIGCLQVARILETWFKLEFLGIDETVFATFEINELPTLQEARFNSGFFEAREHLSGIKLWNISKKVFSTIARVAPISKSMIVRDGCLEDGFGLDKCKKMIEAVDANGDGDGGFLKLTANFDVSS
ncbi:hypothetical protein ACE6H2_002203 [Prunus campanulata]